MRIHENLRNGTSYSFEFSPPRDDEMEKVLWACDLYPDSGRFRKGTPARLKALTLLMRYTGLRIGGHGDLALEHGRGGFIERG